MLPLPLSKIINMEKVSIKHLSNLHNDWLRSLDFYALELGIMKGRLTEIAGKNSDKEMLATVEHFENEFMVKNENIDTLSHNIRENLKKISTEAEHSSAGFIDAPLLTTHSELGTAVGNEEKSINEMRHNFNSFAAKWM